MLLAVSLLRHLRSSSLLSEDQIRPRSLYLSLAYLSGFESLGLAEKILRRWVQQAEIDAGSGPTEH